MTEQMKHLLPLTIKINHYGRHEICRIVTVNKMHYRIDDTDFAEFLVTAANAHDELLKVAKFAEYVAGHGYVGLHKKKDVEKQLADMAKAAIALAGVKTDV